LSAKEEEVQLHFG